MKYLVVLPIILVLFCLYGWAGLGSVLFLGLCAKVDKPMTITADGRGDSSCN